MSEKEPKETVVKLEEHQFQHLSIILSNITQELKNIADKQEKLENGLAKIEGELKLIRMEISELKEKVKK
jgi:chromosome segregation ATPase